MKLRIVEEVVLGEKRGFCLSCVPEEAVLVQFTQLRVLRREQVVNGPGKKWALRVYVCVRTCVHACVMFFSSSFHSPLLGIYSKVC